MSTHLCWEPTARDREKNQARSPASTKACISRQETKKAYRDAGVVEPTSRDPVEWLKYARKLKKMYRNLGCKGEPKTASDAHKCIRKQLKKARSPKPRSPKPQKTLEELLHACREPTARDREKNQARSPASTKACISRHKIEQAYRDAGVVEPTSRDPVEWSNYEDTLKKMYRNLGCKGEPKTASDAHKCIRKQLKKASPKPHSPKPRPPKPRSPKPHSPKHRKTMDEILRAYKAAPPHVMTAEKAARKSSHMLARHKRLIRGDAPRKRIFFYGDDDDDDEDMKGLNVVDDVDNAVEDSDDEDDEDDDSDADEHGNLDDPSFYVPDDEVEDADEDADQAALGALLRNDPSLLSGDALEAKRAEGHERQREADFQRAAAAAAAAGKALDEDTKRALEARHSMRKRNEIPIEMLPRDKGSASIAPKKSKSKKKKSNRKRSAQEQREYEDRVAAARENRRSAAEQPAAQVNVPVLAARKKQRA